MNGKNLSEFTKRTMDIWSHHKGWAPTEISNLINDSFFTRCIELTDYLKVWIDKESNINNGELVLAYVNLGSLVESWLMLFYVLYYDDYKNSLIEHESESKYKRYFDKKGKLLLPNKLQLEELKVFSRGKIWEKGDDCDKWIEKIQQYRNSIHSFNYREVGNYEELKNDVDIFYEFIEKVSSQFPPEPDLIYPNH